jgi:beta-galactosidase/beta-glucuronidase
MISRRPSGTPRRGTRRALIIGSSLVLGLASMAGLTSTGAVAAAPPASSALRQTEAAVPRAEPPRPDFFRADWRTLNGTWSFEFDDQDRGLVEGWPAGTHTFSRRITVPYTFQSRLSGIGDTGFHDVVWYERTFTVPADWRDRRVLLNFGAVDYEARVWVNGREAGAHRGGHVGFALDVTDLLQPSGNVVVVRVFDPGTDLTIPRGKQYWQRASSGIYYTRTTGLWQPVWIEAAGTTRIGALRITPDVDASQARVETDLVTARQATGAAASPVTLRATATFDGVVQAATTARVSGTRGTAVLTLPDQRVWRPDRPALYDLTLELVSSSGDVLDRVQSYFGQRKISVHDGKVYLNDAPFFLKLVLDQGYWPESVLTPPSDAAIQSDIKMTKAFGLNGVRKHQKVADPRYLYWADKLGLLVWGEMANAHDYSPEYAARFSAEWQEIIARDYNHPSIVAWVPINESWGVPRVLTDRAQQAHVASLYHLLKSLDPTRPVVDNDGWEHTDETDLFTLHDYARTGDELAAKYAHLGREGTPIPRNGREALVYGAAWHGAPFLLTEFGGIAFRLGAPGAANEWGYSGVEPTRESFLTRLDGLVKAILANPAWAGFCYTQLTDVEQEINGLMTYDRTPKASPDDYRRIFGGQGAN